MLYLLSETTKVTDSEITVISNETGEIAEYYVGGDSDAVINSSSLMYKVSATGNDSSLGGVFLH